MSGLNAFKDRFAFNEEKVGLVGIERECFITNDSGGIVARAADVLEALTAIDPQKRFCPELSACQVEGHAGPCSLPELRSELKRSDDLLTKALRQLDLGASYQEFAPETMPLDVYPDPTGRYQEIVSRFNQERLRSACRIIGTHVHIGMPNHATALRTYNAVIKHCKGLCLAGDNSAGRRLAVYREVAGCCDPGPHASWCDFYEWACAHGFAQDPRKCWTLIRISVHGTIEFRMFGATDDIDTVVQWADLCQEMCMRAMD